MTGFIPMLSEARARLLRDTTRNLLEAIWADEWPRIGAVVDFGLRSQEHYEALYYGVRAGEIGPEALDAALGKGEELTALARSARSNPHRGIDLPIGMTCSMGPRNRIADNWRWRPECPRWHGAGRCRPAENPGLMNRLGMVRFPAGWAELRPEGTVCLRSPVAPL